MRLSLMIAALLLAPGAACANASLATCRFETECLENEACGESGFSLSVEDDDTHGFILRSDAESVDGLVFNTRANRVPEGTSTLIGATENAYHMLTIAPDGSARYTVHMQGPMMVSYMGECEGMN